jgi:hypothetical protein
MREVLYFFKRFCEFHFRSATCEERHGLYDPESTPVIDISAV